MLTDFYNSFTDRPTSKFAIKSLLNIPPLLKCVAALPCDLSLVTICVVCLGQGADLHMAQAMPLPLPLTISCSSKSRLVHVQICTLTQTQPC